jgi:hypothetical protein
MGSSSLLKVGGGVVAALGSLTLLALAHSCDGNCKLESAALHYPRVMLTAYLASAASMQLSIYSCRSEANNGAMPTVAAAERGALPADCATYLYGIPQSVVGYKLQMPQPHTSDRACPVTLCQPCFYAPTVVGMARSNYDRVRHELHRHGAVKAGRCLGRCLLLLDRLPVSN